MRASHLDSSRTRRAVLLAALGGGAAAAAQFLARPLPVRAGHDATNVLHLGEENLSPGGATTFINSGTLALGGAQIPLESGGERAGVWGQSEAGIGVVGASWDGGGVVGAGGSRQADDLPRPAGPGVIGFAPGAAPGVRALSAKDQGLGEPGTPDGGLALEVLGAARFSTAGSATVPQGETTVMVANPAVTADSHISATLVSEPRGRMLTWIERLPGSGFTAHFDGGNPRSRPSTDFTYLITEPTP